MYTIHEGTPSPVPMSQEDREKVREQLNRLLETHHFSHSKRYPSLLRFVVEETLAGRGDQLKERLLGVRVFDRPADYDTATDPIVRVTVAEIRKRIAQYYHDEEHDAEIRIELMPGRYAPEFRVRGSKRELAASAAPPATEILELSAMGVPQVLAPMHPGVTLELGASQEAPAVQTGGARRWGRFPMAIVLALGLLLVGLAGAFTLRALRPTALDQMWAPLTKSPRMILFCIPTDVEKKHGPDGELNPEEAVRAARSGSTFMQWQALGENVVYSDMVATLRVANVLAVRRHEYQVRLNTMLTLDDLRQGPAVLIGALDNQWTMRALAPLRFHFAGSDAESYWIADARRPGFRDWSLDLNQKYVAVRRDYAIVARLQNEQTGQPQVIVAGIGTSGTAAGGEFISDPQQLEELAKRIGPRFRDHDFEVVLSTDVVNGVAGSPKILAIEVR